jgi:phosphoribosyl 1,2-cyclic phosphate phosphodiesterase
MRITLLGTAAAEGWPAPYCDCDACNEARRRGGPNLRSRSGALIDDDLKIDHNGDTVTQVQRLQRSLASVKTLIFTHQHADHIAAIDLRFIDMAYTNTRPAEPLVVWGNQQVLNIIRSETPEKAQALLDLHLITPLQPFQTHAGDTVLPLPAQHCDGAVMLRITRGGKHLLYGHDSGRYPEETLEALSGVPLDVALFDCTSGARPGTQNNHLNCEGVVMMVEELRSRGAITEQTFCVATHFSHNGRRLHEELVRWFLPHKIAVAYDGMVINA